MSSQSTSALPAGLPAGNAAARETRQTGLLLAGAVAAGGALQIFIEPGPKALVVAALAAGALVFAMSQVMPGRWRETMSGFRFTSSLLVALAVAAILGTLILQNKPLDWYEERYGGVGSLIVLLRLDDIFHSLWFAGLMALFGAAVVSSALLRWPVSRRNTGFFLCHLGLITSLGGAAASAGLTVKGRVDLHAGGERAAGVTVTRNGAPTGELADLGFDLRLDRFDLVRYEPEHRVAYYDLTGPEPKLLASFDPVVGERRLLPGGNSFRVKKLVPEWGNEAGAEMKDPAAILEVKVDGEVTDSPVLFAHRGDWVKVPGGALLFERRQDEVKAYVSHVTASPRASSPAGETKARVAVNEPFSYAGWTLYQVNYDPKDPTYSGFEAVKDPGVSWVFLGFFLISVGVAWMFYVDNRLKQAPARAKAQGAAR